MIFIRNDCGFPIPRRSIPRIIVDIIRGLLSTRPVRIRIVESYVSDGTCFECLECGQRLTTDHREVADHALWSHHKYAFTRVDI